MGWGGGQGKYRRWKKSTPPSSIKKEPGRSRRRKFSGGVAKEGGAPKEEDSPSEATGNSPDGGKWGRGDMHFRFLGSSTSTKDPRDPGWPGLDK